MTPRLLALLVVTATLVGCATEADDGEEEGSTTSEVQAEDREGPATAVPESVQILLDNGVDFCTGVLVNERVALTAAHCIGGNTWTVVAPYAKGAPRRQAKLGEKLSNNFSTSSAARDIAILRLESPITLAHYATVTEIGPEADGGKSFKGVAVGRKVADRTGALVRTKTISITSGKKDGYSTGLKTTYYSNGGDSGGPLFLVEDGKVTHKLVGVERQPEPSRNDDYFTRMDDVVKAAIKRHSN